MNGKLWGTDRAKWASCLRRVVRDEIHFFQQRPPVTGDVLLCRVEAADLMGAFIEDCNGRLQSLFPGDVLLTTTACRESTRWTVGAVPNCNLYEKNRRLTVLSTQGIIGELLEIGEQTSGLIEVSLLGVATDANGQTINISQYRVIKTQHVGDIHKCPTVLITGSSSESGKTTAGISIVRTLLRFDRRVTAFKATGTGSVLESKLYSDAGAFALDTVDFGFATTYPSNATLAQEVFSEWLACLYSLPNETVVIECGGDPVGANVPSMISELRKLNLPLFHISAASDSMAALGLCKWFDTSGLKIDLLCGKCTDTDFMTKRVASITGVPAENLSGRTNFLILESLLSKKSFLHGIQE